MYVSGVSHYLLFSAAIALAPNWVTSSPAPDTDTTSDSSFSRAVDSSLSIRAASASAPHFAIYAIDGVPPASSLKGAFNVLLLAFLSGSTTGPSTTDPGVIQTWAGMNAAQRQEYKDAGITVLVSLFGATPTPTTSNWNPTDTANIAATWIKANGVDGADVDYEDTLAMSAGKGEAWVITFTTELRKQLGEKFIITHAPMAPWFGDSIGLYPGGAYRNIHQSVGSMIDWYNVQFYNAGNAYADCAGLVETSPDQTAVLQIHSEAKVPLNKIVIGKPAIQMDAGAGYIAPPTLSSCIHMVKKAPGGWNAGISFWKYGDQAPQVMQEARKLAFPLQK
ncbi:glycoside hydrolase family 18 protein [Mycena leptocephala]|nr:glycoside hydrolase family 18 protein [Mycena leptocephala]